MFVSLVFVAPVGLVALNVFSQNNEFDEFDGTSLSLNNIKIIFSKLELGRFSIDCSSSSEYSSLFASPQPGVVHYK